MVLHTDLGRFLAQRQDRFESVLPFDLRGCEQVVFDFTEENVELARIDLNDTAGFTDLLFSVIAAKGVSVGIGRYNEDRVVYRHSPLFDGALERRSVHLGIDLFVASGTPVCAPLAGTVHSFADNNALGNYGPTIILEHELEDVRFWTLYGHLGKESLAELACGIRVAAGEELASIGEQHENGGWPPHLHFQLISDILDYRGDFPGVAAPSERGRFLRLCPDPNTILGIKGL
jgi:murein DD-endopeptidase MepM/ murein hydrolase activator NlpD